MTTKYTKGPWRLSEDGDTRTIDIKSDSLTIGTVYLYNKGKKVFDEFEQSANAKLICCAPELLEACIQLQTRLEFMINVTPTGIERNLLCEENINLLLLIEKITE